MNLEEALKVVRENGYIVIKPTKGQLKDMEECENSGFEGNCFECRCSICLMHE